MRKQSEHDQMADRVFAAMHTGNFGQARTLLQEYRADYPVAAADLRMDVVREFGINLEE